MQEKTVGGKTTMVYNFNLGIGWASSGVEYAQAYRARLPFCPPMAIYLSSSPLSENRMRFQ